MAGTTTSMFSASATPPATPSARPMMPIRPLHHETTMMLPGLAPSVRRIAMSRLFVGDRHDERRDNVEGGDGNDQREDDEHHVLSICTARKKLAWLRVQSEKGIHIQHSRQLVSDHRGREQILKLESHPETRSSMR